jgi:transcriptional regulator with XRE-family HTH domain
MSPAKRSGHSPPGSRARKLTGSGGYSGSPAGPSSAGTSAAGPSPAASPVASPVVPLHPDAPPARGAGPRSRHRADELRRSELAAFLRSRRERITPEEAGLPRGGRRRTPGLRREEVAQLAGVGVTWYTWLEQGRDIHVSEQVLEAVARTLMLDPHERSHLYTLAGAQEQTIEKECQAVVPALQVLLDQLEPYPACVQNARFDVLAFNRCYGRMIGDLESMPFEDRNAIWLAFTHPQWRETMVDWEDAVSRMVGQYRAAMAEHVAEPAWKCLVKRLHQASPEFTEVWDLHEVKTPENRTKRLLNWQVGLLRLDYTHLWLGPRFETRMITYTPADEDTRERLSRLHEIITAAARAV